MSRKHREQGRISGLAQMDMGANGSTAGYDMAEIRRRVVRALALPLADLLADTFSVEELQTKTNSLSQLAAVQQLRVLGKPLIVLKGDPTEVEPADRQWELLLPVQGRAEPDEEQEISVTRTYGGAYLETMTRRGVKDLESLYDFFLRDFLPRRKQQLSRPLLYHRVLDGLQSEDVDKLSLAVYFPIHLSLRPVSD